MNNDYHKKENQTETTVGWYWLAGLVLALLCSCPANSAERMTSDRLKEVVCRISNQLGGANSLGSGTLIDKTDDGHEGLVLTCAHLFSEGVGEVLIKFADGKTHHARLIDLDKQADLAALAIANPVGKPVEVVLKMNTQAKLHACGYGPHGVYRCAVGARVGEAASAGQTSLLIGDSVRSGDSGGGVFDEQGRLVAVIWGEAQGVTYASYGRPMQRFLNRVLGRRTSVVYSCPNGTCPRRPPAASRPGLQQPVRPSFPRRDGSGSSDSRWSAGQENFQRQLDELRAQKQDRGDYLTRGELPNLGSFARREEIERLKDESTSRHATLLERMQVIDGRTIGKVAGTAAVGLLGLSGPAGWGVIAAASVGGWLIGRRMKRKLSGAGGRRQRRFRG